MASQEEAEKARARGGNDMRAHASRAGVAVGALAVSLGLLTGCVAYPLSATSDRKQDESACIRASVGSNDRGHFLLPFDLDRDAYRHCMEERGYHPQPSAIQAP